MTLKISKWKKEYKSFLVRGYTGFPECTIHRSGHALSQKMFPSYRSAQIAITKYLKGAAK